MKKIKLFAFIATLLICGTASAQFTNTGNNRKANTSSNSSFGDGAVAGYSGFIETGYTAGIGDYSYNRFEISTSHGFQINSHIFIGMGVGFKYFASESVYGIPFFADFRVNFLDNNISPFVGMKTGYTIGSDSDGIKGFMLSPSIGCRFGFKDNLGLIVSLGYDYQQATVWTLYYSYYYGYYTESSRENLAGLALKIGFEF
jgi:hypothetical protein